MNKNALDHLFREKLEGHTMKPSGDAWSKLKDEMNEEKPNKGFPIWRVAAAVFILLGAGLVTLQYNFSGTATSAVETPANIESKDNTTYVEENNLATTTEVDVQSEKPRTESTTEQVIPQKEITTIANSQTSVKQEVKKEIKTVPVVDQQENLIADATMTEEAASESQIEKNTEMNLINETKTITEAPIAETLAAANVEENVESKSSSNSTIVITYKAGNDDETAKAEETKKKKFGFKSMLAAASDFKNGEITFASIREKKDNLLTLNFSKNKKDKNSN